MITRSWGGSGAAPSALDGHLLTFGDSSSVLYTAMRIPVSLNWTFLILESDEDVVELGRRIDNVVDGKDFDTFAPARSPGWPQQPSRN